MQTKKRTTKNPNSVVRRFIHHRLALIGFITMSILVLAVLILPGLLHLDPYTTGHGIPFSAPSKGFPLGVDNAGRDSFARLVYACRCWSAFCLLQSAC